MELPRHAEALMAENSTWITWITGLIHALPSVEDYNSPPPPPVEFYPAYFRHPSSIGTKGVATAVGAKHLSGKVVMLLLLL